MRSNCFIGQIDNAIMAPAYPEGLKRKVVQACEHGMLRYSASRIKTNAVFHFLESGWSNVRHE
jgi:hypothetical protein